MIVLVTSWPDVAMALLGPVGVIVGALTGAYIRRKAGK